MKVITLNGIIKQVPNSWNDLKQNKEAFIYVIGLMLAQKFTRQEILQLAAFKVLKVSKPKQLLIIKDIENNVNSNHPENLFRLSEIMKFITDETLDVSENLFPKIQNLYAPSSILGDFTAYQYALCEKTFFDFVETNNINDLDKLISLIYNRKKFFTGDFLMFDEKNSLKYQKQISRLDYSIKWCIFRWFAHQRELIIETHRYTFPKGNSNKVENPDVGEIWTDIILTMSQVGDEDKTANTKVGIILRRLEIQNKQYHEAKKQQSKNK